jgi:hypothetical protein
MTVSGTGVYGISRKKPGFGVRSLSTVGILVVERGKQFRVRVTINSYCTPHGFRGSKAVVVRDLEARRVWWVLISFLVAWDFLGASLFLLGTGARP